MVGQSVHINTLLDKAERRLYNPQEAQGEVGASHSLWYTSAVGFIRAYKTKGQE